MHFPQQSSVPGVPCRGLGGTNRQAQSRGKLSVHNNAKWSVSLPVMNISPDEVTGLATNGQRDSSNEFQFPCYPELDFALLHFSQFPG